MSAFEKRDPGAPAGYFEVEAAGLRWLAEAESAGGVRIARVHDVSSTHISMERIDDGSATSSAAVSLGSGLAHLHGTGAAAFGAGPPDWSGDGFIGRAPLSLGSGADGETWGEFYARERVRPYIRLARDTGSLSAADEAVIEAALDTLLDDEDLGGATDVARLHGDLWSGNVMWSGQGPVLIDPAAHGGHPETDLAMLTLFGLPRLGEVLDAYQSVTPLAPGWKERIALHQLHPLLVHVVLFGGGYVAQTVSAARRYA